MYTHKTVVILDGQERVYTAEREEKKDALYYSEKKARTFLRRQHLSVRMKNVIKERCPECKDLTTIVVHDLDVPLLEIEDDLDFLLDGWSM